MTSPLILAQLTDGPLSANDIATRTGMPYRNAIQTLRYLETTGRVIRLTLDKPINGQLMHWHLPTWVAPAKPQPERGRWSPPPIASRPRAFASARYSMRGVIP